MIGYLYRLLFQVMHFNIDFDHTEYADGLGFVLFGRIKLRNAPREI